MQMDYKRVRNRPIKDLTGLVCGQLTVLKRATDYVSPKGAVYVQWECECSCGNHCIKRGTALTSGKAKSCGCARSSSLKDKNVKDLTGQRFGRWTVIERSGSNSSRAAMWKCRCDCGTVAVVNGASLRRGDSTSCGCLNYQLMDGVCLPATEFELSPPFLPRFSGSRRSMSTYAKYYHFPVFYARELRMWHENPFYKGVPLRDFLLNNRVKYLEKPIEKITDMEILRGFTISGILKGFTVFDVKLMNQVLDAFDITSVYDPCAGWGERMLCAWYRDISYLGIDVNTSLLSGYERMIKDFHMESQEFYIADAADFVPDKMYDAVITCPPYGNIEIYSKDGAENLNHSEYLKWWQSVVENCHDICRYFCFQINQKYKEELSDIVEKNGFVFRKEYVYGYAKSSHFMKTSGKDIKKEYESMLVFERCL